MTRRYLPIEDYALIGDGLTAALVGRNGSIDWACFPRFDSPSVFARILDADHGGTWETRPAGQCSATRQYVEDTNVLSTRFVTDSGEAELIDFMPPPSAGPGRLGDNCIVRIIRGRRGTIDFRIRFDPRFQYATAPAAWAVQPGAGVRASCGNAGLTLHTEVALRVTAAGAEGRCRVGAWEEFVLVLTYREPSSALWHDELVPMARRLLEDTEAYWRRWIARCTYRGEHAGMVRRSALALKLLDYGPTGAIVAAPTTSLPEKLGGVRNWDYRYGWIRDTAFTLYALYGLGYREEGEAFLSWILDVARDNPAHLQVLYGVEGEAAVEERELPHLEGYEGSRPVRIGNAAYRQRQLDIFGEILDCALLFQKHGGAISGELWDFLRAVVDYVCRVWTEPDQGLWEIRSGPRHFVYSKALCWIAVDRGLRLARTSDLPADLDVWQRTAAAIHEELLARGYDQRLGAFTQAYESQELDASALALLLRNVLPASDPRMQSTVERIVHGLGENGLLRRYLPRADDGLPGGEGAFLMCSFWLADCYAEMGRLSEARGLLERLLGWANDVGLYAEELDPATGRHLGNFPQAFTHVALINAAVSLTKATAAASRARPRSSEPGSTVPGRRPAADRELGPGGEGLPGSIEWRGRSAGRLEAATGAEHGHEDDAPP